MTNIVIGLGIGLLLGLLIWASVSQFSQPTGSAEKPPPEEQPDQPRTPSWEEIPYQGFPLGNKYSLPFSLPSEGSYELRLLILDANPQQRLITQVDGQEVKRARVPAPKDDQETTIKLGQKKLSQGKHELVVIVPPPEPKDPVPRLDFTFQFRLQP